MAARAELAVDRGDDDVDLGDAAVGRPRLLAVDHPFVACLVVLGDGADRRDVGAGVGLGGAERGDLGIGLAAEALRDPLADLLTRALAEDRGHRERGAHDRHADAGVAPEQLLVDDRKLQARGIGEELGDALEAVEADLRGLLDHRPRRFLALVPFRGGGADDIGGEAVDPVADVLLVLGQLEREGGSVVGVGSLGGGEQILDLGDVAGFGCGRVHVLVVPPGFGRGFYCE